MRRGSWEPTTHDGFYKTLMLNSPVAIVFLDLGGTVIACNPAFEDLFGYDTEEAVGKHIDSLVADEELVQEAAAYTKRILEGGETIRATGRRRTKNGHLMETEMRGVPVSVDGEERGVLVIYDDITARVSAERNLEGIYASLTKILDSLDADVYVSDMEDYEILFMNQHMRESFGGDLAGSICHRVFRNEEKPCRHCSNPRLLDAEGEPTGIFVWEGQNPITERWYKNSDRAITWEDGRYVRLQIATDITDLKKVEERLEHMATHDALTGLPNRVVFHDRLSHAIRMSHRAKRQTGVVFIDLDGFKSVNDSLGHPCGDELLKIAGERMLSAIRDGDTLARVSGDEFAVVLEEICGLDSALLVAERIRQVMSEKYQLTGGEASVTASIGLAVYPDHADSPDDLVRAADEAMYAVKIRGKNGISAAEPR